MELSPLRDTANIPDLFKRPPPTRQPEVDFLHTLGKRFSNFFSKSSLRAKKLRKTNLFWSMYFKRERSHFRLTYVIQKRLLWLFDQVLYWRTSTGSGLFTINSRFFPKAATLVLFVALTEGVAKTVKDAVILHVFEDTTAAISAHLLIDVMAAWTESVVHIFTGKFT